MSLKNKLNRLKPHLSLGSKTEQLGIPLKKASVEIPFLDKWEQENVSPYFLDQDYCLIREVKFPLSYKHGHYYFSDFLTAIDLWNKRKTNHPLSSLGFKPNELFFFDTETTGLGSGVGNTIFLLGYASISEAELILRQHILPHPGAEVALYQSFLEQVNYKTLVTYNGKAFDWPQVKTRHTLVREHVPKLPAFGHFDLFHAARRLWKHKLDRLKLAVVEKEVLGVIREDDIPGFLAPMIYFDFLDSKRPEGMIGIVKHNEMDILSLVTLYTHLTFQLMGVDLNQTRTEAFEVGRWFAALGEKQEAEKVLTKLTNESDATALKAKLTLAYQYKKVRKWEEARALFEEIADAGWGDLSFEACVELAKIFEHRLKDLERALDYCNQAIELMDDSKVAPKLAGKPLKEQLQTRQVRLQRKLIKTQR